MRHTLRVAKKPDGQRWAEDLVRRVGLAMKKARGGKSAKWLSDETAALGYRVSPTVIAKLDSGHRGSVLSVAELMVLAVALDIPPALLLFPTYPSSRVMEVIPGYECDAKSALEWLSGEMALPTRLTPEGRLDIPPDNDGTRLVRAVGELEYWGMELLNNKRTAKESDGATRAAATRAAAYAERRVAETEREIADLWTRLGLSEGVMGEIGGKIHGGINE